MAATRLHQGRRSHLGCGRRQFARDHRVGETAGFVRAVAKRFVGRVAAAAQADGSAAGEPEGVAGGVNDLKLALNANRAVAEHGDFGWHAVFRISKTGAHGGGAARDGAILGIRRRTMATLDWLQCPAVESIPGKVSGAWVFRTDCVLTVHRLQYRRKFSSTLIITATGVLPSFIAGLNLYWRTASKAFSSSPMPSERITRGFCGFPRSEEY